MDFALIMVIALAVTGLIWLYDLWIGRKRRPADAKEPLLIEYSKSFFPVILVVFLLRSFLVEPFKIPSGSMEPTLIPGDFILVNKFDYGIRIPVINQKIIPIHQPKAGDVIVFRYPDDPSIDYIKRVIGVPGDTVTYRNKQLSINGHPVSEQKLGEFPYARGGMNYVNAIRYHESLPNVPHDILVQPDEPTLHFGDVEDFNYRNNCQFYGNDGFSCVVPPGNYFAMGDNRDDSRDSRYWGFVPDRNLVGKAFVIWWNFQQFKRIGTIIH